MTAAQKNRQKIGIVTFNQNEPYFDILRSELNRQAELFGFNCDLRSVKGFSVKNEEAELDQMLKSSIDLLILTPLDDPRIGNCIKKFTDKGIPVITLHTDMPDSSRTCYVGANSLKSGQIAGTLMKDLTGGSGEIAIITGSSKVYCHKMRVKGFVNYVRTFCPAMTVDSIIEAEDDEYKCYEAVQKVLKDNPLINGFFFTAGGVYGGCKGIHQLTTRMSFHVITFTESDVVREYLKKDIIDVTLTESPQDQAVTAITVAADLLAGKETEEQHFLTNYLKIKECL